MAAQKLFFPARCVQPMPVVGDPPGMAPIAGFGAVQCLRSAAHENLGAHDRHLGKNEKMNFGAGDAKLRQCRYKFARDQTRASSVRRR
jgi:hypothetical protein